MRPGLNVVSLDTYFVEACSDVATLEECQIRRDAQATISPIEFYPVSSV